MATERTTKTSPVLQQAQTDVIMARALAEPLPLNTSWEDEEPRMHLRHWMVEVGPSSDLQRAMRETCRVGKILDAKLSRRQWRLIYEAMLAKPR